MSVLSPQLEQQARGGLAPAAPTFRACPSCGSGLASPLHRQEFVVPDQHPLADGYTVVACAGCGMCYADSPARSEDYDDFYRQFNKYADFAMPSTAASAASADVPVRPPAASAWDAERLDGTAQLLVDQFGSDVHVLDVGCGSGYLLYALQRRGITTIAGLDPSPVTVAQLPSTAGCPGYVGTLASAPDEAASPLGNGPFVASLCHVLEHVWDLPAAMAGLRRLVAPGQFVYAEVPDASRFRDHLMVPYHDFNTEHINHFSPTVLAGLFDRAGFEQVTGGRTTIGCSPTGRYPACWGIFRRRADHGPANGPRVSYDAALVAGMQDYIAASAALAEEFAATVSAAFAGENTVAIWGVGELTMKLLTSPDVASRDVVLVDGVASKHGLRVGGRVVSAPETLAGGSCPVLVGSVHSADAIVRAATRAGISPDRLVLLPGALA